jgi:hypothetical protein
LVVTKKRLLLIASVPLAIVVTLGVLAMLPHGPGVTKANFDRIETGMTRTEVEEIFGGPSESKTYTTVGEITTITDVWGQIEQGKCVGLANVNFQDEMVVDKEWHSVPETILGKIRRWLHLP